jgi:TRAP-type C4-dicarboxylate transport system substrate-binding protein
MISSRTAFFLAAALALPSAAPAKVVLKIATLAPEGSAWMQMFDRIKKEVLEATGGEVEFKAYPGGVLGEERDVLFKIKVGQVDGGGFMGSGIGAICPDARALMLPLIFRDFPEVDAVFPKLLPYIEAKCLESGFLALGWTEIGFSYLYGRSPVRTTKDLQGAKPWSVPNDEIFTALFRAGRIGAIPVPVADVLTALQTGLIDTVFAPPLAAVAMQWFTRVKYRNDLRLVYSFGGLFVAERSWEKVPEPLRARVSEICHRRMNELTAEVRRSNEEALQVMASNGIETIASDGAALAEFDAISREADDAMRGSVFSAESLDLVWKNVRAYRESAGTAADAP